MIKKKTIWKICTLLVFIFLSLILVGCRRETEVDYSKMILVVYDGNGGYLRNKTDTMKKILVQPNSKIPKYTDEHVEDPYTTPSLGLATRAGYNLLGWYLAEDVNYTPDPLGGYIFLDSAVGNGVYSLDPNGEYALGYVENPLGKTVFIQIQEAEEGVDKTKEEYIYFYGNNGYGFYIYDPDNAEHAAVYNTVKNIYDDERYSYTYAEISKFGSFYPYDDLTAEEKNLFKDLARYNREYYLPDENDPSIDRYSFGSGYADLNSIMVSDKKGEYVFINKKYEIYDPTNPLHVGEERYNIALKYVFNSTLATPTPSYLDKYKADITYWNFENNRVTKPIVLIAHWAKKCTVSFIQKSGQVTDLTTKFNAERTKEIDLVEGQTIGKAEVIPLYGGYTFVGWSKSEDVYDPWDFEVDVFPIGTNQLNLYAYMYEGTYTRITIATELEKVALNPDGNYLLCNDIDLGGAVFNNRSPLGFSTQNTLNAVPIPFTGRFVSLGYSISNFTMKVSNVQKGIIGSEGEYNNSIDGLFPYVKNAHIEGIKVENVNVIITNDKPKSSDIIYNLGSAGLIGTALAGETTVKDCYVSITFTKTSATYVLDCDVYIGDIVALGKANVTISNTTASITHAALSGITTGTLSVETLP